MATFIDPTEPIAIIGLGGVFPGAKDIPAFWQNIIGKVDSITEVPKDRWDWHLYYDADMSAPDKTYSKIGGFVTDFEFDPLKLRIPPPVADQMDGPHKLAIGSTAMALEDAGYGKKPFDRARTAVIFGNSMGGAKKEASDLRVYTAVFRDKLLKAPSMAHMPEAAREAIAVETVAAVKAGLTTINEDTMPGELSNVIAGRVANVFNLNGPNFTVDAACASSLGAIAQAVNGLRFRQFDMVVTGGVDQMMAAPAYVKFSKIGALSPDGSRPFDAEANGFVMGEGCGVLILKRLSDAVKDGDRIYALIRSIGASSDGKGKGITAPNPKGQKFAIERAFEGLNYRPEDVGLLEAHGTSTRVGDLSEVQAASEVFKDAAPGSIALGSIKSQIGHLKAAAGAAGLVKAALAIFHKTLPPSINYRKPNPGVDWTKCPFYVNTEPRPWESRGKARRANVSAFGFGGTNFHVTLEESTEETRNWTPALHAVSQATLDAAAAGKIPELPASLGGETFCFGGGSPDSVKNRLSALAQDIGPGPLTRLAYRTNLAFQASSGEYVLSLAAESGDRLREKIALVLGAKAPVWEKTPPSFKPKSLFVGRRAAQRPKIAFLFPGQGAQYVDMLKDLSQKYQVVADTFAEADKIMTELVGEKLTDILFTKGGESEETLRAMQDRIKQTEVTQPAVLTADVAILRLLAQFGVEPDVVAGHSLGEYGALVASGVLTFRQALTAVSARAKEMSGLKIDDNGRMASVAAPVDRIEGILKKVDGYVIVANKNCPSQSVIAGASKAVEDAVKLCQAEGIQCQFIEVSHAFHSSIVAPATEAYAAFFSRIKPKAPQIPVLSNVTADYYPADEKDVRDLVTRQIASPVQWIRQIERMYADGIRVFVEVGPKRALSAFVTSTLEDKKDIVVSSSNHPKRGGIHEINDLLARLSAAGVAVDYSVTDLASGGSLYTQGYRAWASQGASPLAETPASVRPAQAPAAPVTAVPTATATEQSLMDRWDLYLGPIMISGVSAGVPGTWDRLFRESALDDVLAGKNLIEPLPEKALHEQLEKNLERVVKSDTGDHRFERMENISQVIRLAGQAGKFDMSEEFGIRSSITSLMDNSGKMVLAAAILALKDAGIPLVRHYKKTTTGSFIPTSWGMPEPLQAETGLIMASAFPGVDSLIDDVSRFFTQKYSGKPAAKVQELYDRMITTLKDPADRKALTDWYFEFRKENPVSGDPEATYKFSRSFLFRVLSLGHAQTAQYIKAMGPCTQINAACASTTQAVGIAEDWIRTGRAKRVIVVAADDISNPTLMGWMGTGFLATGASSTKDVVSEAALPFDRRRSGMIIGMGAVGMVIEDGRQTAARGMKPLAEILATQYDNSAFHMTRLHQDHVSQTMDRLMTKAERRHGISRKEVAAKMLFMSHETYTPAQGGSASAEVEALKQTFGPDTARITVTNTKGFTGHSMGASIEDVIAVRAMYVGKLPPIANYKEPDPDLAGITLSRGGDYDIEYALRLGAGFGSQIAMTLLKRTCKAPEPRVSDPGRNAQWLKDVSGMPDPELEVVQNTLRIKDAGKAAHAVARPTKPAPAAKPAVAARPVPVAAAPAPAAAPAAAAGSGEAEITRAIVALVSEKTGYPADMLELDLDMEADLGIDTVKQAELIGLIRDKYGIAKTENLSLKDYPTLRHVGRFVMQQKGIEAPTPAPSGEGMTNIASRDGAPLGAEGTGVSSAPTAAPAPQPAPAAAPSGLDANLTKEIVALVSEKTGYPADMLELDLDMEADLGIDTVKQAELIGLIRDKYGIAKTENLSLKDYPTLRHVIGFVMQMTDVSAPVAAPAAAQPVAQPAPAPVAAATTAPTPAAGLDEKLTKEIVALVSEKTGYPADMLEFDLDMEADLGIDTVKQAELIGLIRDKYGISKQENLSLKDYPTLRHVIGFVMQQTGIAPTAAPTPAPAPAAAAPAPLAAAPAAASSAGLDPKLAKEITTLVSEKTGYPADMLELDLDMEADLGIDTVKQAELIGMIREKYAISKQENLSLKDYPTLRHVIGFVMQQTGMAATPAATPVAAPAAAPAPAPETKRVTYAVEDETPAPAPAEAAPSSDIDPRFAPWKLEYYARPAENRAPALTKEAATLVLAINAETAEPFLAELEKAGAAPVLLKTADWATEAEASESIRKVLKDRKAEGILDVTTLDLPAFDDMSAAAFDRNYKKTSRALFLTAKTLRPDLEAAGEKAWLLLLTRMGGLHGAGGQPFQPLAGAQTGLAKALSREFAKATVRLVDFDAATATADMLALGLSELGSSDPRREVGYVKGTRYALRLVPYRADGNRRKVTPKSVFLITGGGGALASTMAKEIAKRHKCRLVLLDIHPLRKEAAAWARMTAEELKALKDQTWVEMKQDATRKATPALLEREFGRVLGAIKLHRDIEEIIRLGGKVMYLAGDLTDASSVTKSIKEALKAYGQIDFIIHTAGLDESKLLADKKVENYDRVVRPKAHGAFHLVKSIPACRGQRWVFFSSVVARFGNLAQTDYATANDFLVKLSAQLNARQRSAVAFDLTAFGEIGMATRASVMQFLSAQGVEFMPPKTGIHIMLDRMLDTQEASEVLVAGALGKLDSDALFDRTALSASGEQPRSEGGGPKAVAALAKDGQLFDQELSKNGSGTVTAKTFSLQSDPWLKDHSISGTPYVAGVMGLELLAETAARRAGAVPAGLEDVHFAIPIKLLRNRPITVRTTAKEEADATALSIQSTFVSPKGDKLGDDKTHFTARVQRQAKAAPAAPALPAGSEYVVRAKDIYQAYFHGPSFQVLAGIRTISESELVAVYHRPSAPLWGSGARKLVFQPLLIEAAFQACGYRDLHYAKKMTLPDSIGRVTVFDLGTPPEELFIHVRYKGKEGANKSVYDAAVVDAGGKVWVALEDYRMIQI